MSLLKCSDAQFAKQCGTSLEEYEAFKQRLFGGEGPPPTASLDA